MTDHKLKKDGICFKCGDRCIAKHPPEEPNSCGWVCDDCKCDVCRDAGGNNANRAKVPALQNDIRDRS